MKTLFENPLKKMAGDRIDILGKSYHLQTAASLPVSNPSLLDMILGSFISVNTMIAGKIGVTSINQPGQVVPLQDMLKNQQSTVPTLLPLAYINYVFFDAQLKVVAAGSSQVGASGSIQEHYQDLQNKIAPKNGYVYIYVSNQSPTNVYFDNLQVVHQRSSLLEETHYYPFGLTMAGISSKSAGSLENKRKFNKGSELQNKEFSDGSGLELYATQFRMYDPQIGRWHVIDPKPDYAESPYVGMGNNPIRYNDPLGDTVRVDKSITGDKRLNATFNSFAKTKQGARFLARYAAKGQTVAGKTYTKDGKYSKQGVDLNYNAKSFDKDKGGETSRSVDASGRAQITMSINSNFYEKTTGGALMESFQKVITLFHESFIHADLSTKDFLDNRKFDHSNISDEIKKATGYTVHYQHYKVLLDFNNQGYNTSNLWPGAAFFGLKEINDKSHIFSTDQKLLNEMWDYNGGIDLNQPKK